MENETNVRTEQGRDEKKNHSKNYHRHKKKRNHPPKTDSNTNSEAKETVVQNTEKSSSANTNNNANPQHNKSNHKRRSKHHKNNKPDAPKVKEEMLETNETASSNIELGSDMLDFYDTPKADISTEIKEEELVEIIGVRFKESGKTYYFAPNDIVATKGQSVIVETARGLEFGKVAIANSKVAESEFVPPLRPVVRIATADDVKHYEDNLAKQEEAGKICNEKIIAHNLDMKLIDVQYTFDNSKLLFYFTSSGRVDFRELVKDLASVFKTRIELRQIGIRDEAKLIGGLGICGRPLCCSVFLTDFGQVSIKMAKEQNLSLNSSKISGACGRLMCCLRYEYETYQQEIKELPSLDSYVKTPDGKGIVVELLPLAGKVKVRLDDKPDQQPKAYTKDTVTIIPKQKQ